MLSLAEPDVAEVAEVAELDDGDEEDGDEGDVCEGEVWEGGVCMDGSCDDGEVELCPNATAAKARVSRLHSKSAFNFILGSPLSMCDDDRPSPKSTAHANCGSLYSQGVGES